MIAVFSQMFAYDFITRALIVGLLVSLCASQLGLSLVLKRYSMIGDGLSHVSFGALAIATAFNMAPLTTSIPIVLLAAFLLLRISENSKIKGDAAIALISTSALAIGVTTISLSTGLNTDVCNYLFGSILAMSKSDVYLSIVLCSIVSIVLILLYNKMFAITFDESFAQAVGINVKGYKMILAALTAIVIVLGMRLMGSLLISSLIIFPPLTAMRVFGTFKAVTICAALVAIVCYIYGIFFSYVCAIPAGASVVLVNLFVFALFSVVGSFKGWWAD